MTKQAKNNGTGKNEAINKKAQNLQKSETKKAGIKNASEMKKTDAKAKKEPEPKKAKQPEKAIYLKNLNFKKDFPNNNINHSFGYDTAKGKLKEFSGYGFKEFSIDFEPEHLPVIDAWHYIEEALLIRKFGKKYIFATSFILNSLILDNKELTEANILLLSKEYNKNPLDFYLIEYLQDLENKELTDFANKINLGQKFSDFIQTERKTGKLFELKGKFDKDFVPAVTISDNNFYSLILTRTRDGFSLGVFPMLNSYEIREFKSDIWDTEAIKKMIEISENYLIEISELKEKIAKKAGTEKSKLKAAAEKSELHNKNFAKKKEHILKAKNLKDLKKRFAEARKTDKFGSISKKLSFELHTIYKELQTGFEATETAKEPAKEPAKTETSGASKRDAEQPKNAKTSKKATAKK